MKKLLALLGVLTSAHIDAAPLPPAVPIVTATDLHTAAAEVSVARIDFVVPEKESAAEAALAERFFNRPEEHRYSGLTNADWRVKWQLFSDALVAKAKTAGLDSRSLGAGLRALNQGRNRQTMLWPARSDVGLITMPGMTGEDIQAQEALATKQQQKYERALQEREKHPERWYNDRLAIVPVGAYLGRHAKGECWIIVCKWETIFQEPMGLGHIMVWALDTKSASVAAYVTCD